MSKEAVQLQIDGEDYSVCDIIHKELLNLKHVKFAGVAPPHPLIKTMTVQFHTDGADGLKILNEAIDNAGKKIDELLSIAEKTFPIAIRTVAEPESTPAPVSAEIESPATVPVEAAPSDTPPAAS
jgi:DNA-directed RNA polymerase subunit L